MRARRRRTAQRRARGTGRGAPSGRRPAGRATLSPVRRIQRSPTPPWVPLVLAACSALVGCRAQRELIVTSEPAGARVRVDDELVGETPLRLPFVHYGVRRVTLYLEGYQSMSVLADISPPWYGTFPADILTEILVPVGWRDDHALHLVLSPGEDSLGGPTLRSVFERAEALRRAGPDGPRDLPPPPVLETRIETAPAPEAEPEAAPEDGAAPDTTGTDEPAPQDPPPDSDSAAPPAAPTL